MNGVMSGRVLPCHILLGPIYCTTYITLATDRFTSSKQAPRLGPFAWGPPAITVHILTTVLHIQQYNLITNARLLSVTYDLTRLPEWSRINDFYGFKVQLLRLA